MSEYKDQEDVNVIRRVIAGARDDYEQLVRKYQDQVYSMIMRQIKEEVTARDLAQEVFIKAYLGLKSFRFNSAFSTWLIRITLNVTSNYFSSRQYKERTANLPFEPELHGRATEDTSHLNERMFASLQNSIASLRPKLRDVVVLCALENKSYEETAQILGIPAGTVASRMHSAVEALREKLQGVEK